MTHKDIPIGTENVQVISCVVSVTVDASDALDMIVNTMSNVTIE